MFAPAMEKIKNQLLLVSALLLSGIVHAQNGGWCSSISRVEQQLPGNTQLQIEYDRMKAFLNDANQNSNNRDVIINAQTIFIPVVFHIVHNGDAVGSGENITDEQCKSQLEAMNLHYMAQDVNLVNVPDAFAGLVGSCNIQFCLAKFDPDGNPTTGIIRHQLSNATWDDENTIDNTLKPSTIWDNKRYMNIWSVRMGGDLTSQGVLAYSSLPFFGSADQDGIVARYNTIGTTGTLMASHRLGKTVTHEAGHWLGLLHTWGTDANCGDAGDYVSDTPDQADMNFGCPTFPHISCNNGPNGDMFMNYMDYTDDACSYMFSKGQANNIRTVIDQFRPEIKTASSVCFYSLDASAVKIEFPKDSICSFFFKPVITIRNEGATTLTSFRILYQVDGDAIQTYNWTGSLASQYSIQLTLPEQQLFTQGQHTFNLSLGNVNNSGADNNNTNDDLALTFVAVNGSNGASLPFAESFEGTFPATNWSIENPTSDVIAWVKSAGIGGYGTSQSSVYMDNSAYGTNPFQKKDAFITESFDLGNITKPELKFDVAYAKYGPLRADSLNVYYSPDCGSNWIKVWNQSGLQLATAPDQTTQFIPTSSQWKTVSVPLLNLAGQNKVSFKFENVSGWGNAMYIDNINLQNNPTLGIADEVKRVDIKLYPNPASNMVAVRLPQAHNFKRIQLVNTLGEVVYETEITGTATVLQLENLNSGLYLLHFTGSSASQTERLLIAR